MGAKIRGEGAGPGLANRIGGQREEACPKQIKRDWPKAGLSEVMCFVCAAIQRCGCCARWEGGMEIGLGLGSVPLQSSLLSPTHFLLASLFLSLALRGLCSPQQNVPVFQKKRRVHRGLHMQQSHSSRHRCRLVAIVAPLVP
jgi:hypothetical protein